MFTRHTTRSSSCAFIDSALADVPESVKATRRGDLPALQRLLNKFDSADVSDIVDAVDPHSGATPLICGVMKGHRHIFLYLLRHNASLSISDHNGWTALHWAVYLQRAELACHLLAHDPDADVADVNGMTPADWAERVGGEMLAIFSDVDAAVQFSEFRLLKEPPPLSDAEASDDDADLDMFMSDEDEDEDDLDALSPAARAAEGAEGEPAKQDENKPVIDEEEEDHHDDAVPQPPLAAPQPRSPSPPPSAPRSQGRGDSEPAASSRERAVLGGSKGRFKRLPSTGVTESYDPSAASSADKAAPGTPAAAPAETGLKSPVLSPARARSLDTGMGLGLGDGAPGDLTPPSSASPAPADAQRALRAPQLRQSQPGAGPAAPAQQMSVSLAAPGPLLALPMDDSPRSADRPERRQRGGDPEPHSPAPRPSPSRSTPLARGRPPLPAMPTVHTLPPVPPLTTRRAREGAASAASVPTPGDTPEAGGPPTLSRRPLPAAAVTPASSRPYLSPSPTSPPTDLYVGSPSPSPSPEWEAREADAGDAEVEVEAHMHTSVSGAATASGTPGASRAGRRARPGRGLDAATVDRESIFPRDEANPEIALISGKRAPTPPPDARGAGGGLSPMRQRRLASRSPGGVDRQSLFTPTTREAATGTAEVPPPQITKTPGSVTFSPQVMVTSQKMSTFSDE